MVPSSYLIRVDDSVAQRYPRGYLTIIHICLSARLSNMGKLTPSTPMEGSSHKF